MNSFYILVTFVVFVLILIVLFQHFNKKTILLKNKILTLEEKLNEAIRLIEKNRLLIETNKENILAQKQNKEDWFWAGI